jgi:predicted TIM-barrel fold metal-dependent hydrolase
MIVDSQIHLWAPETPDRPWIPGGQQRAHLPEPLTYQKFLPMMDESGVERAIIVPPTWPGDNNDHPRLAAQRKTWMPAPSAGMTGGEVVPLAFTPAAAG